VFLVVVEVCAGTRIVQAGHALERGTAEQPQRSNAPKLYLFVAKWLEDSVLTGVMRLGIHFPAALPKVPGFRPTLFHIKLKHKAHHLLAGFVHSRDSGRTN
jgi:hypothetical protein